jgi:hypothetical protein
VSLTGSNSGWHKGWFICGTTPSSHFWRTLKKWSDDPAKIEQEKILKDHWAVLRCLRGAGVTLAKSSGSTMPEELCRSGGGRFVSAR